MSLDGFKKMGENDKKDSSKKIIEYSKHPAEGNPWEVAIIGSGPSGLTAGIYTTRGAASTLVIAGDTWGGQLMLTTDVDNYPGFPEGIMGPELMQKMRDQVERFNAKVIDKNAIEIIIDKKPFQIKTSDAEYSAKSIILATGAETKWLEVPGEERLRGKGVSSCAPCDAPFFKEKKVAVVGGGDSAMEEALVLTKYASSVALIHRRNELRASAAMQKKVLENDKIEIFWDSEVVEMIGEEKLTSVKLKTKEGGKQEEDLKTKGVKIQNKQDGYVFWEKDLDGVFVAIGHVPATGIFQGKIDLDEKGYIKRQEKDGFRSTTSVDGVFVAGDVHDYHYRQAVTAAGFGCMAGMDALNFLDKSGPSW